MLGIIALGISDEPRTKSDEHINKNDEPRTKNQERWAKNQAYSRWIKFYYK